MSIIKHVTLQKIVAHDFRYDPRICDFFITGIGCAENLGIIIDSEFFNLAGLVHPVTLSFASLDCLLMLNFILDLN